MTGPAWKPEDDKPAAERLAEKMIEVYDQMGEAAKAARDTPLPVFAVPRRPTLWDILSALGLLGGATAGFLLGWLARSLLR